MPGRSLPVLLLLVTLNAPASERLLIENVTVVSPAGTEVRARRAHVLIAGERIARVSTEALPAGEGTRTLDGEGMYLTPGLTDAHVHVSAIPGLGYLGDGRADRFPELVDAYFEQLPRSLLYHGVTQVLDPNPGQSWGRFTAAPEHPEYFRCEVVGTRLLLRDDPLRAVEAWNSIETVILRGKRIPRGSLTAP